MALSRPEYLLTLLLVLLACVSRAVSQATPIKYNLCVPEERTNECRALDRGNSQVSCVPVQDSVDCALKMLRGEADFGMMSAEEALLAGEMLQREEDFFVAGDVRHEDRIDSEFAFTAVVVARKDSVPSGDLSKENPGTLKFCHPGVGRRSSGWTDMVVKELDFELLRRYDKENCDQWRTFVENEINYVSNHWGPSCRPGIWAFDAVVDTKLKKDYSNLCEMCPDPGACTYGENEDNPLRGALSCLHQGGDVAFLSQEMAGELISAMRPGSEYQLVCRDLTLGHNASTCHWAQQSWPVIVVRQDYSLMGELSPLLNSWLRPLDPRLGLVEPVERQVGGWLRTLVDLLLEDYHVYRPTIDAQMMSSYVNQGRQVHKNVDGICKRRDPLRWCTRLGLEKNKCEWMRAAAMLQGLTPPIQCFTAPSPLECAHLIGSHQADVTTADVDSVFMAASREGMEVAKYLDSKASLQKTIVALVRADSDIKTFEDLKGRKACFPTFQGLAWSAFVRSIKKDGDFSKTCPYSHAIAKYFHESCVPGAHKDPENPKSLCSLCPDNAGGGIGPPIVVNPVKCAADRTNPYWGDAGALACLQKSGEVAFVEIGAVKSAIMDKVVKPGTRETDFRILCTNMTLNPGLTLGQQKNCMLTSVTIGAILQRFNEAAPKVHDISNTLMALDHFFSPDNYYPRPTFHMYGKFNKTDDLIFPGTTLGLYSDSQSVWYPGIANFVHLLQAMHTCGDGTNSAITIGASVTGIFTLLSLVFVLLVRN